jgi:hypothetical protein
VIRDVDVKLLLMYSSINYYVLTFEHLLRQSLHDPEEVGVGAGELVR